MSDGFDAPVRMGIVGLRFGAGLLRRDLLEGPGKPHIAVRGVADLDPELCRRITSAHGLPAYASLDEVLADPEIEAVGLFTPPAGRAGLIRRCLDAGKAVMTTKPFELDPEAARDVLALARARRLPLHLNSPAPLPGADTAQILAWQRELNLGRIVGAHFETYSDKHETPDGSWYDDPERCPAAPIFRIGIYGINELVTLLGPVAAVTVASSRLRTRRPTPDCGQLSLRFADGVIAGVFCLFCVDDGRDNSSSLLLHFERGTVARNLCGAPFPPEARDAEMILECRAPDGTLQRRQASFPAAARTGAYRWDLFRRAVRGEVIEDELPDGNIVDSVRIIAAMREAEKTGRWCEL